MKAMVIAAGAAGNELQWQDVPDPVPGPGELLVAVKAVGMNRADLGLRAGHYERMPTKPPAPIAGLEAAGEVIGAGPGVTGFKPGDRVMGMPSGAYAQKTLLHSRVALRVPQDFSWIEAAAVPVAFLTAHDALVTNAAMQRGESVLVQGATSGVGIAAVQIAKFLGAGRVYGTGSRDKLEKLEAFGLDAGIDYKSEDFSAVVMKHSNDQGVDVVLDMVGASAFAGHMACLALKGRLVQIGRMGGLKTEVDLDLLSKKRIRLIGVTFRTRNVEEFGALVDAMARDLMPAIKSRRLRVPVDRSFALDQAKAAQDYMRSNALFGKVVLTA